MLKHFVAALLIFATVVSAAQSTPGSKQQPAPSLKLTLRTDRQVYRLSEEITLEAQVLNISSKDVYIWESDFCWNPAKGFSMYITAQDGTPVRSRFLLDCLPPPPKPGGAYQFIKLGRQEFHGVRDIFKINDFVDKPGEYDIEVTFNSFLSDSFMREDFADDPIAKLPLWTNDKPPVTASRVHVVVKP